MQYAEQFDKSEKVVENSSCADWLISLPANTQLEDILLKVVAINALYSTRIYSPRPVAEHILKARIDDMLTRGDTEAVERIRVVQFGDKTRNNYSFASKYCAWHNPDSYPIYDGFVDQTLWDYRKRDGFARFQRQSLWRYAEFKQIVVAFREHYASGCLLSGYRQVSMVRRTETC
ncbi:MAG: hypothetical protein M5U29_04595 [Anaerolineae bacterium]|nr:hypothetical protein [Anaerolineae bacterium]